MSRRVTANVSEGRGQCLGGSRPIPRRVTANTSVCAGNHSTPLAISVYRLREVGLPTRVGSVYRQGQGRYTDTPQPDLPTRASRSTDSYPLGLPTLPPPTGDNSNCRGSIFAGHLK